MIGRTCLRKLALVAWAAAGVVPVGAAVLPPHLAALRLHGPVRIAGEPAATLEQRMRELDVHGVSVAACANGEIRWAEAYGLADVEAGTPATPKTLFQAGSISKPVAATGVMREVQAGRLALDRDVNTYLKSWKLPGNALTKRHPVTLERILSHSAGLTVHGFPGYAPGAAIPTLPQILDGQPPANTAAVRVDFEPGSRFRYSGGGTTIAQLVLSDMAGQPFPELLDRLVLAPAGMRDSSFEQPLPPGTLERAAAGYRRDGSAVPGKRHIYPEMAAAGLWTTPSDLCRFAMSIQRSLRGEEGALLGKALAERMTTAVSGDAGLGFFVERHGSTVTFGHGGADEGFQAMLLASRDHGYAGAVMVNSDNGVRLAVEILRGIAEREEWNGFLPPPLQLVAMGESDLAALAGRYRIHGDEALEVAVRGNRLFGRTPLAPEFALFPVAGGELARRDVLTRYRILSGGDAALEVVEPEEGEDPEERSVAPRMAPGDRLPSDLLAAGDVAGAIDAYRKLFGAAPKDRGVSEDRLNAMGYRLAGEDEAVKALAVLRLNAELYPTSTNTYDSLAEVTLQSGDHAGALALYRKVLEVIPRDRATESGLKDRLRANAEAKIRELTEKGAS